MKNLFAKPVFSAGSVILLGCGIYTACARRPKGDTQPAQVVTTQQGNKITTVIKEGKVEKLAGVATPEPSKEPETPVKVAPPTLADVQAAVKRIYGDLVTVDASHSPAFVSGEFNGDAWEDLAVVVRAGRTEPALKDLNDDFANWTVNDAVAFKLPDPNSALNIIPTTDRRPKVQKGELLIAVIHGYEDQGWRNPEARQTYLVKGATGTGLKVEDAKDLFTSIKDSRKLLFKGHQVIVDRVSGRNGILFWAGGAYAWFADSELSKRESPVAEK